MKFPPTILITNEEWNIAVDKALDKLKEEKITIK